MSLLLILAAQSADPEILVTASRVPVTSDETAVSATVIDEKRIEAIGALQAVDLLRLTPGLSVAVGGARGTQAQVRIRGAEANHSLLFIDGIQYNDPAGGNEPRFEILGTDGIGRVEIVRGPQSALWGSEAMGGVIALDSAAPTKGVRLAAAGEYGSHDTLRGSASAGLGGEHAGANLVASRVESDGNDIIGGGTGDRDGFSTSTFGGKAVARPDANSEIGFVGRYIDHHSEFDGFDPLTFQRADTGDNQDIETGALRAYATIGTDPAKPWGATIEVQYLDSSNRNFNGNTALNRTSGDRKQVSGQVERRIGNHVLIAALDYEAESFKARDQQFFGATDQDRTRRRTAFVGEWRAQWSGRFSTDVALRHDDFNRFADETTLRASAVFGLTHSLSIAASYGEGIAQPTFFDLYGFFPGSFAGNPDIKPETSRGYEVALRWTGERASASVTGFDNRLKDEIVGTFDPVTFLSSTANATGTSKRRGIELAGALEPSPGLRLSANYTWLDTDDQQVEGGARLREVRRPRHSANTAFDWEKGPLTLGGYLAYVGKRKDTDFDLFPALDVTLDDYALASLRVAYRISGGVEAFGRVENGFDADYQDVVGYETPGRAVYAGLRFRFGD
jgi:vitamin B12 transporter